MDKYAAFYEERKQKLFAYLIRVTGDYYLSGDIMQESFTRLLERYSQEERSVPLLYAIARNLVLDGARRQAGTVHLEGEQSDRSVDQERLLMAREEYRRVLSAMQQLGKEERDVLALAVSGELSYREIASVAGISESNVKVKVHRARLKLREILQEGDV
ncbi:MAG: RNA polymerase sigma factor [Thermodesulfobacteriota bacterium]